ncbi:MAG TPA: M14 family metallopeptidase [Gaiellaceae bacterium]|nr:M14 family metallopeptidase [Gaiellaceae bacterium]
MPAAVAYDRWHRYDELTELLRSWADELPGLMKVESIGKSYEGRDIWLVTVTNFESGPDLEKPAFLVEANIHAIEVTGCTAALHLIHRLLTGYGDDDRVTRALDTRAFYVVPRLNPDGAELALADRPRFVRSSVRPYPLADPQDGLHEEDLDGDGRILMMRLPDDNGAWKQHADEPRLMIRREPDEGPGEGQFYRLLWEGTIRNYDGVTIKIAPPLEGLDLNRNFPYEWSTEAEQRGAGPYPTSEPEVRAMVQAVVERPNITGHIAYHTFSGVHLRPYAGYADEYFPPNDLRAYKLIGEEGTRLTGYPNVSVFHDFKYEPKESIKGSAHDWLYDHVGVFAWTTEFWSPQRRAGIEDYQFIEWLRDHSPEDDLKLLKWAEDEVGERAYVDWYEFEHPQLGTVELGGWDVMACWGNVPFKFLRDEIAPHADWALWHLSISPLLSMRSLDVEPLGDDRFFVRLVLENTGWLPTYVTQKAVERQSVRPLEVELTLPEGARVVAGELRTEAGQLEGRVHLRSALWWGTDQGTSDRAKLEWVVEAPLGGTLGVEARHPRAGVVRRDVNLSTKEEV